MKKKKPLSPLCSMKKKGKREREREKVLVP